MLDNTPSRVSDWKTASRVPRVTEWLTKWYFFFQNDRDFWPKWSLFEKLVNSCDTHFPYNTCAAFRTRNSGTLVPKVLKSYVRTIKWLIWFCQPVNTIEKWLAVYPKIAIAGPLPEKLSTKKKNLVFEFKGGGYIELSVF